MDKLFLAILSEEEEPCTLDGHSIVDTGQADHLSDRELDLAV